jgi:hypothetical protein
MTLELAGFGDDTTNTPAGTALAAERHGLPVTTAWRKFTLPIPNPAKFTGVNGLFYLADGTADSKGKTLFLADIVYVHLGSALGTPAPAIAAGAQALSVPRYETSLLAKGNNQAIWTVTGDAANPVTLSPVGNAYFDYTSSDSTIASVSPAGLITGVLVGGPVNVTATLAGTPATGSYAVTVTFALARPSTLPPTPPVAAGPLVYSLYSSVPGGYNGTASDQSAKVDTWLTTWSGGTGGAPFAISDGTNSANPRKYILTPAGNYAGIEFIGAAGGNEIDAVALGLDTLHVDLWTPDDSGNLQVVLTDFGADGAYQGAGANADTTGIKTLTAGSSPVLTTGTWMSLDLKLATDFPGLAGLHHLAQMQFVAPPGGTVYVDNVYFYNSTGGGGGGGTGPTTLAAVPTAAAGNVISLFSSAYAGGIGDFSAKVGSYDASCFGGAPGSSTVTDFIIPGTSHTVKQYTVAANSFLSIETIGATGGTTPNGDSAACNGGTQNGANLIDISTMTGLHLDVWSTKAAVTFNGAVYTAPATLPFNTGAGAVSAPIGNKTFAAGTWVPIDITFGDLSQITRMSLLQLFSGEGGTIYVDNIYFYKGSSGGGGGVTAPTILAPTPTVAAANVISIYNSSGTYTDQPVVDWFPNWGQATTFADVVIAGKTVKKYSGMNYQGWDFTGTPVDASTFTHLHVDIWTPDATKFGVAVINLASTPTEFIVPFNASTTPPITKGAWIGLDIPLTAFTGMTFGAITQIKWVDNAQAGPGADEFGTFFIDNVYFYKGTGGGGGAPTAPTTTLTPDVAVHPVGNVVSVYNSSGTYADQPVVDWFPNWGQTTTFADVVIAGKTVKKYSGMNYQGWQFSAPVDASTFTHLHVDIWTPNATKFGVAVINLASTPTEFIVPFNASTTPTITKGSWISLEIPLTAFSGMTFGAISQMKWVDNAQAGPGADEFGTFFIDNVYFWK